MIIKNGIVAEEKEKVALEDFIRERERLQLILNDYGKAFISRRLPFSHVQDMYSRFASAGSTIFKNGSNKLHVYIPQKLLKRVRGII